MWLDKLWRQQSFLMTEPTWTALCMEWQSIEFKYTSWHTHHVCHVPTVKLALFYSKMLFMSRLVNWIKPIYGLRNIPTDVIPGMMTSPDFLGLKYNIKTTYFSIKSPLSAIRIYAAIHGNSLVICVMWYCFLYFSDRIRQTGYRQAVIFCIHSLSADLPYKMWYKCNDIHAEAYICLITNACFCASFDYMYNA